MILTITEQQKDDIVAALDAKLGDNPHKCSICQSTNIDVPEVPVNENTMSYYVIANVFPLVKALPFMCNDCGHDMTHELSQLGFADMKLGQVVNFDNLNTPEE